MVGLFGCKTIRKVGQFQLGPSVASCVQSCRRGHGVSSQQKSSSFSRGLVVAVFCRKHMLIYCAVKDVSVEMFSVSLDLACNTSCQRKLPMAVNALSLLASTPWSFVPAFVWNGGYLGNPPSRTSSAIALEALRNSEKKQEIL